jgi:hypothetical protein
MYYYGTASSPIPNDEHSDLFDPFTIAPPIDCSFTSFDRWSCSPTGTIDNTNTDSSDDVVNDWGTLTTSAATSSNPMFIDPRHLIVLTSPVLHQDLFEKFEPLLRMCKAPITFFHCFEYI